MRTESVGLATKNFDSGIDRPGVAPLSHEAPDELVVAEGTKTLYEPDESTYSYGFSRLAGVVASVVYGPPHAAAAGKHSAGAPTTPENTWFQTPFDHPPTVLLRT